MRFKNLKHITKQQQHILDGLSQIDKEISGFYQDALLILTSDCVLASKVNLVAHLSREIDGGFRNIYAPKSLHKEESKNGGAHKASILIAMGHKNREVSDEWFKISTQFAAYAHRHGLETRTLADFNGLWERYEKVLIFLVGSNYAFHDRVDQLTSIDLPTADMLNSLVYFFKDPQKEFLFYKTLQKPGWLIPLKKCGFFDLNTAFPNQTQPLNHGYPEWLPLRYLENIATRVSLEEEAVILEIIRDLQARIITGTLFLDDYVIYLVCRILANLPAYIFTAYDAEFLLAFSRYWDHPHRMFESEVSREMLQKMLKKGSAAGLTALLTFGLGYMRHEKKVEGLEEYHVYSQIRYQPNISETYQSTLSQHLPEIMALGGIGLLKQLADILRNLATDQSSELMSLPSIEVSEQRMMRYNEWMYVLPDFISRGAELLPSGDKFTFLAGLISEREAIFHRIAFHLIRLDYGASSPIFWQYIAEQPLDAYFPIHELYLMTREHSNAFSEDQFQLYLNWVDQMNFETEHLSAEERAGAMVYRKRKYLNALHPGGDAHADLLKEAKAKYEAVNNYPLEHPEYDSYSTVSHGYDVPDNAADIKGQSVAEQIQLMRDHRDTDNFDTTGSGIGLLMRNYIIQEPSKYVQEIELILSVRPQFLKQVVSGLEAVLKNDAIDDWKPVGAAIDRRVGAAGFDQEDKFRHSSQTMTEVAEFYLTLSRKDERYRFSTADLAHLLGKIIHYLDMDAYKTPEPVSNQVADYHLNTLPGKLFEALINFCGLWSAHLATDEKHRLPPAVLAYFEANLGRTAEKDKGFSLGLGYHFSFLLYADREWCDSQAARIFPAENVLHKDLTLNALLSPYHYVYQSVITFLKAHDLNSYLVSHYRTDSGQLTHLTKIALVEYFEIVPAVLDDHTSLIAQLLAAALPLQLEKVVNVTVALEIVSADLLLNLWQRLIEIGLGNPDNYAELLKNLLRLLLLVGELSADFLKLVENSLPYLVGDVIAYSTVRSLIRLSSGDPQSSGQVVLRIWQQTGIRVEVSKDLLQFVEGLYLKGLSVLADDLCRYVAQAGEIGLKAIYDNYQLKGFNATT